MRKVIKVVTALLLCSALSIFAWLIAVALAFSRSGLGVGTSKPPTASDSAIVFIALGFPFLLFPFTGWLLRNEIKLHGVLLFSLAPFVLIALLFILFQIREEMILSKMREDNPATGERVRYSSDGKITQILNTKDHQKHGVNIEFCADGTPRAYGHYENGLGTGTHLYRDACNSNIVTVTQFGRPGDPIDRKRLYGNNLKEHTFRDTSYADGIKDITLEYRSIEGSNKWFLDSRSFKIRNNPDPNSLPRRTEHQAFYEDGRLATESYSEDRVTVQKKFDRNGTITSETTQTGGDRTVKVFDQKGHAVQECQYNVMNELVFVKDPNSKCSTNSYSFSISDRSTRS